MLWQKFKKYFDVEDDQPYYQFTGPDMPGFRCHFWRGGVIVAILFVNKHSNNYEFAASAPEYPSLTSDEIDMISAKLKELNADVSVSR